jgi:hypothetical protein
MSFCADKLVTAGPEGRIQLFRINEQELGTRGKGLEHIDELSLSNETFVIQTLSHLFNLSGFFVIKYEH